MTPTAYLVNMCKIKTEENKLIVNNKIIIVKIVLTTSEEVSVGIS